MYEEKTTYKGYTIEITRDEFAENPFEAWDCEPALIVDYGERITTYGDIEVEAPEFTREELKKHARTILDAIGYKSYMQLVSLETYNYASAVDCINDAIHEVVDGMSTADQFRALEALYNLKQGYVAWYNVSKGYCQGDHADVLVIATPEWIDRVGAYSLLHGEPSALQSSVDLYSAWVWGDVYGYMVTDNEGEEIAACCGYYGADHEKSGLIEAAHAEIDAHIAHKRRAHFERLKKQIKARAPLYAREAMPV